MAGGAREGWRTDPYRRHELRYWDGLAWTEHVSDLGVAGVDPVFPVLNSDAHDYLTPVRPRRRRRLPGLDRAAAWAVSGFLGVIALATFSAMGGGGTPAGLPPQVDGVEVAAAQVPANDDGEREDRTATAASRPPTRTAQTVLALLAAVPVHAAEGASDDGGRLRAAGPDPDGAGCDVRQEVLRRDLTQVRLTADGCTVRSGELRDPYSGVTVRHRLGAAEPAVRVDHAVAMTAAWRTGAAHLTDEELRALANDPLNLLAVSAEGPRTRGSADAAAWLPRDRSTRCSYVARQIAVKAAYGLWVTPAEQNAMRAVLATCPAQPLPTR